MNSPEPFLPHRKPLLLLDAILDSDEKSVWSVTRVDPDAWYADTSGAMPAWFGLELMAQTIAAYSGIQATGRGEAVRMGYLLGTRACPCSVSAFPAGSEVRTHVVLHYFDNSGLSAFQGRILLDGVEVATALVKTFEVP